MQEMARQQALKAMGVAVLLPRYQLPGAAISSVLEPALLQQASEPSIDEYTSVSTTDDTANTASMAARVLALQTQTSETWEAPAAISNEPPPSAAHSPEASRSSFDVLENLSLGVSAKANLALLEAERDVFIIDQVPEGQVFSKYQVMFLSDVLLAFGLHTQTALKDEQLSWPPRYMAGAVQEAGQALVELLQGKIQALSPQLKGVIILGQGLDQLANALASVSDSVNVLYSPYSSAQVMMNPEYKVQLWHSLQGLQQWRVNPS